MGGGETTQILLMCHWPHPCESVGTYTMQAVPVTSLNIDSCLKEYFVTFSSSLKHQNEIHASGT